MSVIKQTPRGLDFPSGRMRGNTMVRSTAQKPESVPAKHLGLPTGRVVREESLPVILPAPSAPGRVVPTRLPVPVSRPEALPAHRSAPPGSGLPAGMIDGRVLSAIFHSRFVFMHSHTANRGSTSVARLLPCEKA